MADINVSDRSEKTSFLSRNLMRDAMKGLDTETAYFRVMNGPTEGTRIEIADAQEYVFGRDGGDADIVLNDDLVSRRHAKVRRDWSGTHVEDLGSRNGIKVNRKRTKKEQLRDRDELEIGGVKLLFIDPSEPREDAVVLSDPGEEEAEGEHTESGGQALEEPETEERSPPEEAPPEPPPEEEPPPPEPEESPEESSVEAPPPDDEPSYEAPAYTAPGEPEEAPAGNNPLRNIDFKNPQHLVVLIMGGVFVILGVVLIIALLAGA